MTSLFVSVTDHSLSTSVRFPDRVLDTFQNSSRTAVVNDAANALLSRPNRLLLSVIQDPNSKFDLV